MDSGDEDTDRIVLEPAKLRKRRVKLADGRYLIYFDFERTPSDRAAGHGGGAASGRRGDV